MPLDLDERRRRDRERARAKAKAKAKRPRRDGFGNLRIVEERFASEEQMKAMQLKHGIHGIELDTLLFEDYPTYGTNILYRRIGSPPPPEARPLSVGALKPR